MRDQQTKDEIADWADPKKGPIWTTIRMSTTVAAISAALRCGIGNVELEDGKPRFSLQTLERGWLEPLIVVIHDHHRPSTRGEIYAERRLADYSDEADLWFGVAAWARERTRVEP